MLILKLILIYLNLSAFQAVNESEKCTDEKPWNCKFQGLQDEHLPIVRKDDFLFILGDIYKSNTTRPPKHFDSRKEWPKCEKVINKIKNQGRCDSCWAHCTTQSFADRMCISAKGKLQLDFSVQDLVFCCKECAPENKPSCRRGASLSQAMNFLTKRGIVTTPCKPYDTSRDSIPCQTWCTSRYYRVPYYGDIHQTDGIVYGLQKHHPFTVRDIQLEILKNGPMCTSITINEHFIKIYLDPKFNKKDVYVNPLPNQTKWSLKSRQGHSVRVIGWGDRKGVPYWLIANSWGTKWGDKGFFKLRRGNRELQIEERFYAPSLTENEDFVTNDKELSESKADVFLCQIFLSVYVVSVGIVTSF